MELYLLLILEQIELVCSRQHPYKGFNLIEQDNTVVITGLGTVGMGTTNPGVGVTALNDSTQGKLSLDLETPLSIEETFMILPVLTVRMVHS